MAVKPAINGPIYGIILNSPAKNAIITANENLSPIKVSPIVNKIVIIRLCNVIPIKYRFNNLLLAKIMRFTSCEYFSCVTESIIFVNKVSFRRKKKVINEMENIAISKSPSIDIEKVKSDVICDVFTSDDILLTA